MFDFSNAAPGGPAIWQGQYPSYGNQLGGYGFGPGYGNGYGYGPRLGFGYSGYPQWPSHPYAMHPQHFWNTPYAQMPLFYGK